MNNKSHNTASNYNYKENGIVLIVVTSMLALPKEYSNDFFQHFFVLSNFIFISEFSELRTNTSHDLCASSC
jgi:hypothetical protein